MHETRKVEIMSFIEGYVKAVVKYVGGTEEQAFPAAIKAAKETYTTKIIYRSALAEVLEMLK